MIPVTAAPAAPIRPIASDMSAASATVLLWEHGAGYDANGLGYIIGLRRKHYIRQQQERSLKQGERVALLGRGIAVVKRVDENEAAVAFRKKIILQIARKDIVLNHDNRRWECAATAQLSFLTHLDERL